MAVKLSPLFNDAQLDASGNPLSGGKLYTYAAGSTTAQTAYQDSAGATPHANPIVLNSRGEPPAPIWLTSGQPYKFDLQTAAAASIRTIDNVSGVNDTTSTFDQWVSGPAPTYISATSFSLVGDQTSTFQVGRRVKTTNSGGTVYSTITASAFAAVTTVTVVNDSGTLDSGLSAVSYGILSKTSDSLPRDIFMTPAQAKGHIFGLTMSTAGSSATMAIAAGVAVDSTGAAAMALAASISKTTSAWAVGTAAGGLDTGAIANSTWYHFFLIKRLDTGVVDVLISLSPTGPTMPANYTLCRRIGSGFTNGSAQWTAFVQDGDLFQWLAPVADINVGNPGTSAVSRTLTVPSGLRVTAKTQITISNSGTGGIVYSYFSDLSTTDTAASSSLTDTSGCQGSANWVQLAAVLKDIVTNTSAQIRSRISFSDGSVGVRINTLGWIDRRGRDA